MMSTLKTGISFTTESVGKSPISAETESVLNRIVLKYKTKLESIMKRVLAQIFQ